MTYVFLLAEFIVVSGVLLGMARMGTTAVVVVVASMQFLQALLGATMYWEFADGLLLSPGSCVFFASNVAILLYIYVTRGASEARSIFYTIVGSNLVVVVLCALLYAHIKAAPPVNFLGLNVDIFDTSWSAALVGTSVLALTQLLALTIFNRVRTLWPSAPIPVAFTLALSSALVFDTFGYLVPVFWGDPNLGTMLTSGVVSKGAAGVVFGITWGAWAQRNRTRHTESLRNLFEVLMWADKAESFRTDTAELYRKSELNADDAFGTRPREFLSDRDWTEDEFRRWLTRLPYGVCVISDEKVRLANANFVAQAGEALGEDLLGRSIYQYLHPSDLDELRHVADAPEASGDGTALEHPLERADGTTVTLESVALALRFEGARSLVLMTRDITEKKQLRDQLSHADRLAAVGTLTATVAHEINNPLTYLLSNQDYLIETIERLKPSASPEVAAHLDDLIAAASDAREGARRIQSVVSDLRKFTRNESHEIARVDIAEVIDSSIKMAMPQIKHRAKLVREVKDLACVDANAQQLGQVLLNLLVNAAQAIDVGASTDNEIRITAATENDVVVVKVSDTGCGIEPHVQNRIMEPFYTTKPAEKGSGLGLATCQSIVESFGGEIGFESTPGEGSTFWISVPLSSADVPEQHDDSTSEAEDVGRRRILIIDDERALARAFARMARPHEVTICSSAGEALALLEDDRDFDVIFCDVMMPNITGVQFYHQLVERNAKLAACMVFITGSAYTSSAKSFLEGVDLPCFHKPFDWDEVHAFIEKHGHD